MKAEIHAIILTLDEEKHIARCIASIRDHCTSITVIDSGSSDRTPEIARGLGATVLTNRWVNHATQINFGIGALAGCGGWLFRIDADEILDPASQQTLSGAVDAELIGVDGLLLQRRIHFMGRRIRFGAIEPSWQLRIWRNGTGRCEQRWMDEHIKVSGRIAKSGIIISDINLNSLTWWTAKHNSYASREAIDILNRRYCFLKEDSFGNSGAGWQARIRRLLKETIYLRIPGGWRAAAYYLYRYIFRLGALDGMPGFYFHLMQGLWYRTLVDAKVIEIIAHAEREGVSITDAIKRCTDIDPTPPEMRAP